MAAEEDGTIPQEQSSGEHQGQGQGEAAGTPQHRYPFYLKGTVILFGIMLSIIVLYYARGILIPIAFAAFFSIFLYPLERFLEQHGLPRIAAILLCLLLTFLVAVGIFFIISSQLAGFTENLPQFTARLESMFDNVQRYIREEFNISTRRQVEWLREMSNRSLTTGSELLGGAMLAAFDIIELFTLVPIYIFLFLFYQELFEEFLMRVFSRRRDRATAREIVIKSRSILNRYLVGIAIETVVVAILNILGLTLLGIEYAILFGVIAALLNLIPYVGIIIGSILPIIMALLTKDSFWYPLGVIGIFGVIQFIDNNIIVPIVVGGKISINGIVAIVALIAGAQLWGVSGMILSLPFVALLKVVFDSVDSLKPWGMLLGDEIPRVRVPWSKEGGTSS